MITYLFPAIALFLIYILFIIYVHNKRKKFSFIEHSILLTFVIYLIAVISVTFFPLPVDPRLIADSIKFNWSEINNFIPFHTILVTIKDSIQLNSPGIFFKQILGNMILFFPFGFYLFLIKKNITLKKVMLYSFFFSLGIECTQELINLILGYNYRAMDIDDILLNTTGGIIGCITANKLFPIMNRLLDYPNLIQKD